MKVIAALVILGMVGLAALFIMSAAPSVKIYSGVNVIGVAPSGTAGETVAVAAE